MGRLLIVVVLATMTLAGCAGSRLSSREARQKIIEIASSPMVPDAVEIRRIVSQTESLAVAETTVTLAFQFRKDETSGEWVVEAVRLGDRQWVDLNHLLAAVNEGRSRETGEGMQKLADGIAAYRRANQAIPPASDIVGLTDILHPTYMPDLIRLDAWGRPIEYEATETSFRLISRGPDALLGTPDDIVVSAPWNPEPVL